MIQGAAGSVTKLATIYFRQWVLSKGYEDKVFITNVIHDEINVECSESISKEVANALIYAMEASGDHWCKTVKLTANYKISEYWTH